MVPKYYEEIQVGDEYRSRGRTVTQTDKINFLNMTRNNEELFSNKDYYEKEGYHHLLPVGHRIAK